VLTIVVVFLIAVAAFISLQLLYGRRDAALYGPIVDFNRRLSNIAVLRTMPAALRFEVAAIWDGSSAVGEPPPTVRLIGPDGKPVDEDVPGSGPGEAYGSRVPRVPSAAASPLSGGYPGEGTVVAGSGEVGGRAGASAVPGTTQLASGADSMKLSPERTLHQMMVRRRRKMVFEVLSGAFVATFVLGLLPGMRPILFISMAVGLALAGYAAYLRKLKLEEDAHGSRGKAFLQ
jgi:hypothetical protein